ncbi:MAG: hypothetical protein RLY93_11690 [Sumerlaeia bacterium]
MEENELRTQTLFSIAMTSLFSLGLFFTGAFLCAVGTTGLLPVLFLAAGTLLWGWCALDLFAVERRNTLLAAQSTAAAGVWFFSLWTLLA